MKRTTLNVFLFIIMLAAVVISGYFIFRPNSSSLDYSQYNIAKQQLVQSTRQTSFKYCDGEAYLALKDGTYNVSVALGNATANLYDIDILVMDGTADATAKGTYPSLGLIEDEHNNLVPKVNASGASRSSYLLSFTSDNSVSLVYVYLAYTYENVRYQEYVQLETIS